MSTLWTICRRRLLKTLNNPLDVFDQKVIKIPLCRRNNGEVFQEINQVKILELRYPGITSFLLQVLQCRDIVQQIGGFQENNGRVPLHGNRDLLEIFFVPGNFVGHFLVLGQRGDEKIDIVTEKEIEFFFRGSDIDAIFEYIVE